MKLLLFCILAFQSLCSEQNIPIASENGEQEEYGNADFKTNGELFLLQHYLKPGFTVFDIGAHVGIWSLDALGLEPDISLYCFEPTPSSYESLVANLFLATTNLYNFAISDRPGQTLFYFSDDPGQSALNSCFRRDVFPASTRKMQVPMDTLDHFSETHHIGRIDYVKIDTEGSEYAVLLGAKTLLDNHQIKALQFEYGGTYPDAGIRLRDLFQFLSNAGYLIFRISPRGIRPIPQWDPSFENEQYCNYFAIVQEEMPPYKPAAFQNDLKVFFTSALIDQQFDSRKEEYIHSLKIMESYGLLPDTYVIEAGPDTPRSFFPQYAHHVFYAATNNLSLRNKGVNESNSILKALDQIPIPGDAMILKLTGRYFFNSDQLIKIIKNHPECDAFVKYDSVGQVFTGCYALRHKYFAALYRQLDLEKMEAHAINIEFEVAKFINKLEAENQIKVMRLDRLDLTAKIFGFGIPELTHW